MSNVKLGATSKTRLRSVDPKLQEVCLKAFETMPFDIVVLEGIRTSERQAELFKQGASKTMNSKHLTGKAIDLAPYPVDWKDIERFTIMAEHVLAAADELGVKVRWGGTWSNSAKDPKAKFFDGPHVELV